VITASNGVEALDLLGDVKPDLIISDIMMPDVDGYQFHAQVRRRPELLAIPFIFLTARGGRDDIRRGKELGVDDYLTKPFDEEDLLIAVRAKLSRWEDLKRIQDEQIADLKHKILLTLSHEFRTPLAYIINYAQMLEVDQDEISPQDFAQFMQGIRRGAVRLNRLVEDFILLVEIETGEAQRAYYRRRRDIADAGTWLRVIARSHTHAAEANNLKLELQIPEGLPGILADEAYLSDAVGRLIENAIKFSTPESEWVRVKASADETHLRVTVEDQGVGIQTDEMERLFNVFHQIDRAKQEQQGTGSGLAICSAFVELHGGNVTVDSKPGEGSAFTILLPLQPPES
jgi:two-component system sensor histidine kinase/response regulator